MAISNKIRGFMEKGSWIRKMFEEGIALKQQYGDENVFDLSLGNPVMNPPERFYEELKKISENPIDGMHRYMPNAGLTETRTAVAKGLSNETGLSFTANEIVMTCGAGGALNVIMKTLLDPGEEFVIFAPFFVEYNFYADNHGGSCKVVPPDENFLPDMEVFRSSINSKTRGVLINSPNNPSGIIYGDETLSEMCRIIKEKEVEFGTEIYLVSDEPYRKIIFDNLEYTHIFKYHDRSIVATSHSKDLALPGERIGYIAVNPSCPDIEELVDGLVFCNRTLGFVNAPALIQHLIAHLQDTTIDVRIYEKKRDYLYKELTNMGYSLIKPQGAFYMFPKSPIEDDVQFSEELKENRVLVVPGSGFGLPGYFRISYCMEDATIQGSLEGLEKTILKYRQ
ncbi:MAG: pyridoxal phosphate-dependent aminotransferase [Dehalococcoidia bacterium]|uniref:Aminotransferase class I/classII large domain-containing protein n=1 Tax=marine metagenome TaxID=408172 RepID=A0A381QCZ6_9ZZZZ|nr:aspartate aminotransferase [Dehalococcoidia bacterium]MCS5649339.1 pyridoxal phosphate-dependent aminotransferase [Dehalococcoidia bacterium]MEC7914140.1 pyridoxal phosphate-dependent aminotransferase [Chloroflexota bacterium]HBR65555.1 pyridoxal phosphate-dependent aminotransferase [Dehalococcoidia bacterium]|tara:strand:+ start:5164 stop:6348 length:1185 start_codon:yes stop_codon:yes gene_type:complete